MSTYTVELRFIAESLTGKTKIRDVITDFRPMLFSSSYPFPDDERESFERHIIQNFYNREIGYETWALFHLKFNTKMSLIMPKYGILASQIKEKYNNLLGNIDITEKNDTTGNEKQNNSANVSRETNVETGTETTSTNNSQSEDKLRHSDTPQGGLTGLETDTYMSSADLNNYENTSSGSGTSAVSSAETLGETTAEQKNKDETSTSTTHRTGYMGSKTFVELMSECNAEILNLTEQVCKELNELFISLY